MSTDNTTATATDTERAERGTSINAQAKFIIRQIAKERKLNSNLLEAIDALNAELPTSAPNMSLEDKIAAATAKLNEVVASGKVNAKGVPTFTGEQIQEIAALQNKIARWQNTLNPPAKKEKKATA